MSETNQADRAEALIARIEAETQVEIDRIEAEARAEAAVIVKAAHGRVRERVHREIEALKRVRADALRHEAAHLDTKRRQVRRREARAEIEAGLPALEAAFKEMWANTDDRIAWARAALATAARRLTPGVWTIAHAKGLTAADKQVLAQEVEAVTGAAPVFAADATIASGLRLSADRAWLDASGAALMADTDATGAALLAEIARDREGRS